MELEEAKLVADLIEAKKHLNKAFLKMSRFTGLDRYQIDLDTVVGHISIADDALDSIIKDFNYE